MIWVYVLENTADSSWYIGSTSNLRRRIKEHTSGSGSATTARKEWKLIYCEGYLNSHDGRSREKFLKSGSGRRFLKKQLRYYLQENSYSKDTRL